MSVHTLHAVLVCVSDLQWDGASLSVNGCWKRQYIGIGSTRRAAERDALRQHGTGWRADGWASNDGSWRMGSAMVGAWTEEGGPLTLELDGPTMQGSGLMPASWCHVATVRLGARAYDVTVRGLRNRRSARRAIVREAAEHFARQDYMEGTP